MKKVNQTILVASALFCWTSTTHGQKSSDQISPFFKTTTSISGGLYAPSKVAKDNASLVNSDVLNADVFVALITKGWDGSVKGHGIKKGWDGSVKGHKFAIGLNVSGAFISGGSGNPTTPTPNSIAIYGGTSTIAYRGSDPKNPGFRTGLGPQLTIKFGKLAVSPILLGEYFSMTQNEQSATQTAVYNGQTYNFDLSKRLETKTTGFSVTPKIRHQYLISSRIGLFADASYTMGPKSQSQISTLVPLGAQLQDGTYELQSLEMGTRITTKSTTTALNFFGANVGIIIGLGKVAYTDDIKKG